MTCTNCGKPLPDGAQHCPKCGQPVKNAAGGAAKAADAKKAPPAPASPEKRQLYKAADVDPERPSQRVEDEKAPRRRRRRAPIVTAAIWLLAILLLAAVAFAVGHLVSNSYKNNSVPDSSEIEDETDGEQQDEQRGLPDSETVPPPPEKKPVYDILGAWRWESDKDGYRDTYWVFSEDGKLSIYMTGFSYDYSWPRDYTYDEANYVLDLTGQAMGLAWLDEDSFACGTGKAFRIDESEIPSDAVDVRELESSAPPPAETVDEYLLPSSDSKYLTREDLAELEPDMLRFARNEIFARHGRLFSDDALQEYFNKQSWYNGYIRPANFNSSVLNAYERYNAAFISKYEEEIKARNP